MKGKCRPLNCEKIAVYKHKTFDALCLSRTFLADQCEGEWPGLMRASKKSTSDSTGLADCGSLPTTRVCVDK